MYPVSFLFALPDYQVSCVHALEYVFSYMLQQSLVFPSLDYFSLVKSPHISHEGVFLRADDDDKFMYCDLPYGFHIQCVRQLDDCSCPHADHHALHSLMTELSVLCAPRYPFLGRLFEVLVGEEGSTPVDSCAFCFHRTQSVDLLLRTLTKPYPFLTRSSIERFYRYPARKGTDVGLLLQPHIVSVHYLFSQMRNPSLREKLVGGIYDAFVDCEGAVEEAVEENDDDKMNACTKRFKNRILDIIDQCCPFVNVRKIDFKRWLLTLVYFDSIQQKVPLDNGDALRLVKKSLLLLHLYFHTPVTLTKDAVLYLEDKNASRCIHVDVEPLNKVHPAFRGEYITA